MSQKLDEKTKELIALGCSVAAKCQPCLKYHIKKAEEVGVEKWQINEAIALGKMIADKSNEFMAKFADEATGDSKEEPPCCNPEDPSACAV